MRRQFILKKTNNGDLLLEETSSKPEQVHMTLRTEIPEPAEVYLDAACDWSTTDFNALTHDLHLEYSVWLSERDIN